MKGREIKNLPASIKTRLMTLARRDNRPFDEMLKYFAIERFLYRLSRSKYKDKFLLKGALLFQAWGMSTFRPTRDIDLLGYTDNQVETLVKVVREICSQAVTADGMGFDPKSVHGERITEDADYKGVRIRFQGHLGKTRIPLQMDVGFADVVFPSQTHLKYPALLDLPVPELRGYPAETVVAEKLQAMAVLGMINSRMKDFYDLLIMAGHFSFKGASLQKAILRTFQNRKTPIPGNLPALTDQFAQEKQKQWQAFLFRNLLKDAPDGLSEVIRLLRTFLLPVLEACVNDMTFDQTWSIKGHWE
jgi:predicted nucleotidyltransferase component of viral defense system